MNLEQKTYRNIFKETGKTDEQIRRKLEEAWNTFFVDDEERIYHEAGDDMGYLCDTGNNDARTEGMSYGMMMCVQLDKKDEFDRIWKWATTKVTSHGHARRAARRMPKVPLPTERNSLPWHYSSHPTDGATAKVSSTTAPRQERS